MRFAWHKFSIIKSSVNFWIQKQHYLGSLKLRLHNNVRKPYLLLTHLHFCSIRVWSTETNSRKFANGFLFQESSFLAAHLFKSKKFSKNPTCGPFRSGNFIPDQAFKGFHVFFSNPAGNCVVFILQG